MLEFMETVLFIVCLAIGCYYWLLHSIKKEVVGLKPKVPMTMCDAQHLYPTKHGLSIVVEGLEEPVPVCPICYAANLQNAEKIKEI